MLLFCVEGQIAGVAGPCLRIGNGHDHLGAILRDAARLVLLADHEAIDVLQKDQRHSSLGAELDKVCSCSDTLLLTLYFLHHPSWVCRL